MIAPLYPWLSNYFHDCPTISMTAPLFPWLLHYFHNSPTISMTVPLFSWLNHYFNDSTTIFMICPLFPWLPNCHGCKNICCPGVRWLYSDYIGHHGIKVIAKLFCWSYFIIKTISTSKEISVEISSDISAGTWNPAGRRLSSSPRGPALTDCNEADCCLSVWLVWCQLPN